MKSGRRVLWVLCLICLLQVLLTIYLILKVYVSNVLRPDQLKENENKFSYDNPEAYNAQDFIIEENVQKNNEGDLKKIDMTNEQIFKKNERELLKVGHIETVEVWGKAAIATYLWEHILGGTKSVDPLDPTIYSSRLTTSKCNLIYKEGPGLGLDRLSENIHYLVLVLNGRTQDKISESKQWLEHINNLLNAPKIILVMLGNEHCENDWVLDFMEPKGPIYGSFITYDDPVSDENIKFQWPLGVATYRRFPLLSLNDVNVSHSRKFLCNLQATTYENSTRKLLFSLLKSSETGQKYCKIKERKEWNSAETAESSAEYLNILLQSDLTLCPAGFNTETYRVYEALAAGSIPVVEDVPSGGSCDASAGWRLFKEFNSPVIWISDWNDLPKLLEKEANISLEEKIRRRKKLLNWYEWFKLRNRDRLLSFIFKLISKH